MLFILLCSCRSCRKTEEGLHNVCRNADRIQSSVLPAVSQVAAVQVSVPAVLQDMAVRAAVSSAVVPSSFAAVPSSFAAAVLQGAAA